MFEKLFRKKKSIKLSLVDGLFLTSGLGVFIALTMATITKSSIWFDEAFGIYLTKFNFFDIAKYTATDVHPPLYYWLLKGWQAIFGSSELAVRSMSLFFGCLAIIAAYLLIVKLFNKNAARVSLAFLVVSPMIVRYSQEARMYTLVAFIAILATLVLTYALESKKKLPWVIYGILVSLGMWTHYFAAIIWITHWIWRADNVRRVSNKKAFIKNFFTKEWLLAHYVAVGLFVPWLPFFVHQAIVVQAFGFWIPAVTPDTIPNFLTNILYYMDIATVNGWFAMAFFALIGWLLYLSKKVYDKQNTDDKKSYRLIMFLAFVPMIILFIASMPPLRSTFIDRYLMASSFAVAMFIGLTIALGTKKKKINTNVLISVAIIGLMLVGVTNVWHFGNYNKNSHTANNTREAVRLFETNSEKGQPVIAATPWLFYEVSCYETSDHSAYFIEPDNYPFSSLDMLKYNDFSKIKNVDEFAKSNSKFWYVVYAKDGEFKKPYDNWNELKRFTTKDSISGDQNYIVLEYEMIKK